jgi:fructokinase
MKSILSPGLCLLRVMDYIEDMKILCFGEVLWDHIEEKYHLGGAPLNFAAHSAQFGSESYIISAVGNDELGKRTLEEVKKVHVKTDFIESVDYPTGVVEVTMSSGIPSYEIIKGTAWDHISPSSGQLDQLKNTDWDLFYLGSLAQRSQGNFSLLHDRLLTELKAKIVFFDVNLRQSYYNKEIIETTLNHTTILKLNDEELPTISTLLHEEELPPVPLFMRLSSKFPKLDMIILTRGPEGADIITPEGLRSFPIESDVTVIDTVGAGDSYSGAFCFAWFHTKDLEISARFAQDVADRVVSQAGALPDYGEEILTRAGEMA